MRTKGSEHIEAFSGAKPTRIENALRLSYDIVKADLGELKVETDEREGSKFIQLLKMIVGAAFRVQQFLGIVFTRGRWIGKWYVALTIFLIPLFGQAQLQSIDSLKTEFARTNIDTVKVRLFKDLASAYAFYKPDSAFYYATEGIDLAKKISDPSGEAWNTFWLAVYFRFVGASGEAMNSATRALSIFERIGNTSGTIVSLQMIGWVAIDFHDYPRALHYHFRAARLSELHQNYRLYYSYGTLAEIHMKFNTLDSALYYAQKTYQVWDKQRGYPLGVLARINQRLNHDALALQFYHKAVHFRPQSDRIGLYETFTGMAKLFYKTGPLDSSLHYATKAYSIARENGFLLNLSETTNLLATIYKKTKYRDSTLKYMQITIDLKDSLFSQDKVRQFQSMVSSEKLLQQERESERLQYQARVRTYVFLTSIIFVTSLAVVFFQSNRKTRKTNSQLKHQKEAIETTLTDLKQTQSQLIQSEKMASLGELTAGIAHEIQNPLNFVNNFSEVSNELLDEMNANLASGNWQPAAEIARDVKQNMEKILHHGKRADAIVKGMLQHSRKSSGKKEPTDINELCDEYLRLAYHGWRAKDKSFNAKFETHLDPALPKINVVPQEIGRVVLNLINNAFYACSERSRSAVNEQRATNNEAYEPTVTVSTKRSDNNVLICVKDNGNGIPESIKDKIFQPFFTTKPTGQGTGLGLSLSYDIIKSHGGELKVDTQEGEGSQFIIQLPASDPG